MKCPEAAKKGTSQLAEAAEELLEEKASSESAQGTELLACDKLV